jgi:PAS domain S-box-containing protein
MNMPDQHLNEMHLDGEPSPKEKRSPLQTNNGPVSEATSISDLANELFECTPEAILLVDSRSIVHRANREFTQLFQYTEQELKGRNIDHILARGPGMVEAADLTELVGSGDKVSLESIRYRKDGTPVNVSILGVPIRLKNGDSAVYVIYRDITEWKKTQENLIESQTKYRTLFESATDAIFLMKDDLFVDCNEPTLAVFNCKREDIIGKSPHIFSPKTQPDGQDSIVKAQQYIRSAYAGKSQFFEWLHKRLDGTPFHAEVILNRVELKGEYYLQAMVRDISQRKKAEILQKRRIDFIEFISQVSSDFINLPLFEIDAAIERALQFAARSSKVERGYILLLNEESNKLELAYEWYDETVLPRKGLYSYFESAYSQDLVESLGQGKLIKLQRSEIIPTAQSRMSNEMLDLLEVKSLIYIPFSIHEKNVGYIGFDATAQQIDWTEEFVNIFKLTGQIVANAIHRKKDELELTRAKEKAEESDKLKTAFLASMSHEIRTPMNHIMGFLELLNFTELDQAERQEFLNIIRASGDNLLRLIDDIIDIAKIESHQVELEETTISIQKFLNDIFVTYQDLIAVDEKSGIEIALDIADEQPPAEIITDPQRLQQVLNNLLVNAIKFTNKGKITLGCKLQSNNRLLFFVSDTGIGIPKEKLGSIFERFRQLDYGYTRSFGGTGLGLAISKGLIEVLGGEIWVESEINAGSTFFFTIPYKPAETISETKEKPFDADKINWSDKSILIVEDDDMNAKFLKIILSKTKARLFNARNGQEAIDMAHKTAFDLILMDIQIPIIDGYEATRMIREFDPSTTIIAQTAHAMTDERTHCLEAGCNDYLSKPINRKELLNKIQMFFNGG